MNPAKRILGILIPGCILFGVVTIALFQARAGYPDIVLLSNRAIVLIGLAAGGLFAIAIFSKSQKYAGIEHGSAHWGRPRDIRQLQDKDDRNTIILTATERVSMNQRKTNFANHVLVVGAPGTGKSRNYVKPNILQMNGSYVVTDPSGELLASTGGVLQANGYQVKVFNILDVSKSLHLNPFHYFTSIKAIGEYVDLLMENTSGDTSNPKSKEDFWVKAERLWLSAHMNYLLEECTPEERTMPSLMMLLNASEAREDDESYKSAVDVLFDDLERKNPSSFAVKQYKKYKMAAGKTAKSILISVGVRLQHFDIPDFAELFSEDELELEKVGTEKTALFLIMDETNTTYNYMVAILLSALFETNINLAKNLPGRRLPIRIRCIIDEAKNIGRFPHLDNLLATTRKYEIGFEPIYQDIKQIKSQYKDDWETILACCPIKLFLGGTGPETIKYVAEQMLGDTTVRATTHGSNAKGALGADGTSTSEQASARKLMDATEVSMLPSDECILKIQGYPPFRSKKYKLEKHPDYKLLADEDGKPPFTFQRAGTREVTLSTQNLIQI